MISRCRHYKNFLKEFQQSSHAQQSDNNTSTEAQVLVDNQSLQDGQTSGHMNTADDSEEGVTSLSKSTESIERRLQAILSKFDSLPNSNQFLQIQPLSIYNTLHPSPPPYYPSYGYPYGPHHMYNGYNPLGQQPFTNFIPNNWTPKTQTKMMERKPQDN